MDFNKIFGKFHDGQSSRFHVLCTACLLSPLCLGQSVPAINYHISSWVMLLAKGLISNTYGDLQRLTGHVSTCVAGKENVCPFELCCLAKSAARYH